jgi:SAM-dependent methyltransferase
LNLFDMARRKDPNLRISGEVEMAKKSIGEDLWRGVNVLPGSSFRIPDARRFVSFRAFPAHCGWMVDTPPGTALRVRVESGDDGKVYAERKFEGSFQPLFLPWPKAVTGPVDLVVSSEGSVKVPVFVANHRALSRQWLYDLCTGNGIEIGPGPQPQILPSELVKVSYLEQMPPEEWNRLYNGGGKYPVRPELWDSYIVGEASDLPVPEGSLDFVFGSHVFEHLVNPVGHLARWRGKLAKGGRVICVVPDLAGTKDSIQQRCTLESLLDEFGRDVWVPDTAHYVRHLRRPAQDRSLVAAMQRMESIHVHYYDNINCQLLLDYAVRELGYADYAIEHTPNHKDFHFVLVNQ